MILNDPAERGQRDDGFLSCRFISLLHFDFFGRAPSLLSVRTSHVPLPPKPLFHPLPVFLYGHFKFTFVPYKKKDNLFRSLRNRFSDNSF